ncbi:hypothetical protein AV955_gp071 [Diadromus pulchellus ascovirus 4a]|uniref:Complete DpAV4 genome n=1 Tax=Diadromus pulchellus ascovirus 4a TaxID=158683 RepID=F2NZ00_9VIRU|nr:hypothetical protein AV955_gp071 [Diadromus pulchellus ascovirus 4a]CCA61428.1 unnamed protein product [Diadromus pulchellus ascovirus 4a]
MFRVINVEFLQLLNLVDKNSETDLYRFIENLIMFPSEEADRLKNELEQKGGLETINTIRRLCNDRFPPKTKSIDSKRKVVIKEDMIENYIVKHGLDKKILDAINTKMSLKSLSSKNVVVKDGIVVDIRL